jgi:hypothetical protein
VGGRLCEQAQAAQMYAIWPGQLFLAPLAYVLHFLKVYLKPKEKASPKGTVFLASTSSIRGVT